MQGSQKTNKLSEINFVAVLIFIGKHRLSIFLSLFIFLVLGISLSFYNLRYLSSIRLDISEQNVPFNRTPEKMVEIYKNLFGNPHYANMYSKVFYANLNSISSSSSKQIIKTPVPENDFADYLTDKVSRRLEKDYTIFSRMPLHIHVLNESKIVLTILTEKKGQSLNLTNSAISALNSVITEHNNREKQLRNSAIEAFYSFRKRSEEIFSNDPVLEQYSEKVLTADEKIFDLRKIIAEETKQNLSSIPSKNSHNETTATTDLLDKIHFLKEENLIENANYLRYFKLLVEAQKYYIDAKIVKVSMNEQIKNMENILVTDFYNLIKKSQLEAYHLNQFKNSTTDSFKVRDQIVGADILFYCVSSLLLGIGFGLLIPVLKVVTKTYRLSSK